jgi:hypothetical protein
MKSLKILAWLLMFSVVVFAQDKGYWIDTQHEWSFNYVKHQYEIVSVSQFKQHLNAKKVDSTKVILRKLLSPFEDEEQAELYEIKIAGKMKFIGHQKWRPAKWILVEERR